MVFAYAAVSAAQKPRQPPTGVRSFIPIRIQRRSFAPSAALRRKFSYGGFFRWWFFHSKGWACGQQEVRPPSPPLLSGEKQRGAFI